MNSILLDADAPRALLVLAHGAGAGMRHSFMDAIAKELAANGISTLRYEFEYMEQKRNRTDPPAVAQQRVRDAVAEAARLRPGLKLLAGGKSFGGRMTSGAAAAPPGLPNVAGIVFVGFPLHPPNKPSTSRADHLDQVTQPMLFLQGTRDDLADLALLRPVIDRVGRRATLHIVEGADHSFSVLKRTGRTNAEVLTELATTIAAWANAL